MNRDDQYYRNYLLALVGCEQNGQDVIDDIKALVAIAIGSSKEGAYPSTKPVVIAQICDALKIESIHDDLMDRRIPRKKECGPCSTVGVSFAPPDFLLEMLKDLQKDLEKASKEKGQSIGVHDKPLSDDVEVSQKADPPSPGSGEKTD